MNAATLELEKRRDDALKAILENVPYNRFLEVSVDRLGDELTARLPFRDEIVGNPFLPAIHGGVMGAFLEITAQVQLGWLQVSEHGAVNSEDNAAISGGAIPRIPKSIDISIDYLRSARPRETFARANVQKAGRRVVHLHVTAWQDQRERPVAMLRGNFLMPE
ncbi:MAG: PaaI family thioesterase [Pseudomonadota bacterium]